MKKQKDILPKSQLVNELNDVEFIKQPYLYATVGGDFTLTQRGIMIEIINSLQDRFNAFLKNRKNGVQLDLFAQEEKQGKDLMTFRIESSSLGVKPDAYAVLEQTCNNMLDMKVSYLQRDETTGQLRRVYANLFVDISIPVSKKTDGAYNYKKNDTRRAGYVEVRMSIDTLKYLCDLNNGLGYLQHIRRIARVCRRKRTPSIYIYLAKFKDAGHKSVDLLELKKYLGLMETVTETDESGNKVEREKDSYPKFSRFCSTVLDPIKEDLDELAENNVVDFSFSYSPVYKTSHRGNPDEILFELKLSGLGEELRQQRNRINQPADAWTLLRTEYKLTDTDVKGLSDMLPDTLVNEFRKYVLELGDMVKRYKPNSVKAYVITSLKNFITSHTPQQQSAPTEQKGQQRETEASPTPQPTEKELQAWQIFMDVIKTNCTVMDYNTWLSFLDYGGSVGGTVTIKVPTAFFYTYIQENFKSLLEQASEAAFGEKAKIKYDIIQK